MWLYLLFQFTVDLFVRIIFIKIQNLAILLYAWVTYRMQNRGLKLTKIMGKKIEIKSTMNFYRHSKPKYFWCINEGNLLTRERKQVVDESLYSKLHALSVWNGAIFTHTSRLINLHRARCQTVVDTVAIQAVAYKQLSNKFPWADGHNRDITSIHQAARIFFHTSKASTYASTARVPHVKKLGVRVWYPLSSWRASRADGSAIADAMLGPTKRAKEPVSAARPMSIVVDAGIKFFGLMSSFVENLKCFTCCRSLKNFVKGDPWKPRLFWIVHRVTANTKYL